MLGSSKRVHPLSLALLIVVLFAVLFAVALWGSRTVLANVVDSEGGTQRIAQFMPFRGVVGDSDKIEGIVEAMPSSGLHGEWIINGLTYVATVNTDFEQDDGPLVVGACVKLKLWGHGTPPMLEEIETQSLSDCHEAKAYGRIDSLPAGLIGTWVINGITYATTATTSFDADHGSFAVNACVKVKYLTNTTPYQIEEIETEKNAKCGGSVPGATPTPNLPDMKIKGRIDSLPDGLTGEWVIGGVAYTATNGTDFKPDHGMFQRGACVEIKYWMIDGARVAKKIQTEEMHECNAAGGVVQHGTLYGRIQRVPNGLLGTWNVGGTDFIADQYTVLDQTDALFAVGVTAKVKFFVGDDGMNHATAIDAKSHTDDDDMEGKVYGPIDSLPNGGLIGLWTIGGNGYTVNYGTDLERDHGDFAVGANVKVKFYVDASNQRIATEIETTAARGGASAANHFMHFGFVTKMPPSGFAGQWVVNDLAFTATDMAKFDESRGLLAIGAYVAVEYYTSGGQNLLHAIETHVPPGAGDNNSTGKIESMSSVSAARIGSVAATWFIGGKPYTVNPATHLNEQKGNLAVGSTVSVNSYTTAGGSEVATQIRRIDENEQVVLPVVRR